MSNKSEEIFELFKEFELEKRKKLSEFYRRIMNCTVMIETVTKEDFHKTGTGFLFLFEINGRRIPCVITNKHVIEDSERGKMMFTLARDQQGTKTNTLSIDKDFRNKWLKLEDVDLALFTLASNMNKLHEDYNVQLNNFFIRESQIPASYDFTSDDESVGGLFDIYMPGYPTGLRDNIHNLPIMRKGITATPPAQNFNGQPNFLIDCACFGGSSGSPVFTYDSRTDLFVLLGILSDAGIVENKGYFKTQNYGNKKEIIVNALSHIGYVIHSSKLRDFIQHLEIYLEIEKQSNVDEKQD